MDWPHQTYAFTEVVAAYQRGERRVCVTSPTGGGKTRIMSALTQHFLDLAKNVSLYTNRKLLLDQTSKVLTAAGQYHGVRASGYEDEREHPLQISSIQTEASRVLKKGAWQLHDADLVLIDEAHLQTAGTARKILDAHHQEGALYVGFTATPLDLGGLYDTLIVAGTPSELRACGALVPCYHYGPDEPDLKKIGKVALGEDLTEKQNVKAIMTPTIFARVLEWWSNLNPEQKPTILFAPGVKESVWFAEQFRLIGVTAASIDGEHISFGEIDGNGNSVLYPTTPELRRQVLAASKDGSIKVLCNRFVLREGIDAPWLCHGIFATVFGSLQTYLQSGGRLLRSSPGKEKAVIQDHGGSWWRHGSLNADREWHLEYTSAIVSGLREERLRKKVDKEPVRCPMCGLILACAKCRCGFEVKSRRKSRPVIQTDGTLKQMQGDVFRSRREYRQPNAEKIWTTMYYRAKNAGMTFNQARALFAMENNWGWPAPTLPMMPTREIDWFKKVSEVPRERLT